MYICYFIKFLSPLGKGRGPLFKQTWILITQVCFVLNLIQIGQVVLEKKMKMWKVYDNDNINDDENDDGQRTKFAFGSGELKIRVSRCQWT